MMFLTAAVQCLVYEVMNVVATAASHNILCGRKSRDTTLLLRPLMAAKSRPGEWYASPWLIKLLKEQLDDIRTLTNFQGTILIPKVKNRFVVIT